MCRTLSELEGHSFETLSEKLRSKSTLEATKALLKILIRTRPAPPNQNRIFLSAYMTVAAPQMIFQEMGELEQVCMHAR